MKHVIDILDYGTGSIGSLVNMIKKVGGKAQVIYTAKEIQNSRKLILPGVGSFDFGMDNLNKNKLVDALNTAVLQNKIPILGICLGMQLLVTKSEEGKKMGLNWIKASVKRFNFSDDKHKDLKVPHMAWNSVKIKQNNLLFKHIVDENRFYFTHSYHLSGVALDNIVTETSYGYSFISSIHQDNIYGVQFHPEKSHQYGKQVIKNFLEL
ncbi:imidazole glycerol phosphate synthase subunit HisH [Candidatus Marinamargulisbacteria bacterium SCGC AG-333-B06]|nr:imidazole glycerol phosphate synthase subunit HisH [Candidatus Marinamargulisbacteria bacterium SCGC AG-333-B06]